MLILIHILFLMTMLFLGTFVKDVDMIIVLKILPNIEIARLNIFDQMDIIRCFIFILENTEFYAFLPNGHNLMFLEIDSPLYFRNYFF